MQCLNVDSNLLTLMKRQPFQSMLAQPNMKIKMNETKPRLGKDEVDMLEREFERNPKPTTQTKRQFAEDMGVDLSRINNWFQNRRAKRKQEKKQATYQAGQAQETLTTYSKPSSPVFNCAILQINETTASLDLLSGSPSSVGVRNRIPSYFDRSRNGKSPEKWSPDSPKLATAYNISESEQWCWQISSSNSFSSPSPPINIASRRKFGHKPAALTAHSLQHIPKSKPLEHLPIFSCKSPEPFVEKNHHTIGLPPLSVGSSLNSSLPSPKPMLPPEKEITLANGRILRFTALPSDAFAFDKSLPADFLDECKPGLYNTKNAAQARDENPQPIERGLSPVLTVVDEERSVTHATIVEEVEIKAEIGCHPRDSHQDEDVLEDDDCASDKSEHLGSSYKACNAIPSSVLEEEHDDLILPILNPMQQDLIERIMDEFWLIFNQDWAARIIQYQGSCSPTPGDNQNSATTTRNVSLLNSQQKRQRSYEEDSADESGNKKPRKQRGGPRPSTELNQLARFACPFRKHDPQRYSIHSHRVCALTSWDTIARVKEHLYRNHKAAPYCKRCWKVFESEEQFDSHATVPATSICEASPGNPPEGITPKQVVELRSKAKPYSKQNEAERWKDIFRLLFPGESAPSPYWEPVQEHVPSSPNSQILMRYDDYMHQELPRLFRSRVEEVVRREMQPVEVSLLANLEGLIRECQDQLSSGYQETHMAEQQSKAPPTQITETLSDPENSINTAANLRMIPVDKDQQPSSDFFDAVLQAPPLQEEDYVLDFSASDAELFGSHKNTSSSNLSESGYVSVPRCSCKEHCECFASMIHSESPDFDISEVSWLT